MVGAGCLSPGKRDPGQYAQSERSSQEHGGRPGADLPVRECSHDHQHASAYDLAHGRPSGHESREAREHDQATSHYGDTQIRLRRPGLDGAAQRTGDEVDEPQAEPDEH